MPPTLTLDAAGSPEAGHHKNRMLWALQSALRAPAADDEALEAGLVEALLAYDDYRDHVQTAHPMQCAVGCTACCHDNPRGVAGVELERLARVIATWPDAEAVKAKLLALSQAADRDPRRWRARRQPCPLLDDAGCCRAYAHRPIACRAFVALTPASWCDPADPRHEERVNPHLDPPQVLLQILMALSARRGLPPSADLQGGLAALLARSG